MGEFIELSIGGWRTMATKNGNELELEPGDDLGEMKSDQAKLTKCLRNLVSNAAKFTKDGTIRVHVRREKDGRVHRMHLEAAPMREAQAWIDRYRAVWERQLDALAEFLESTTLEEVEGAEGT